MAVFEITDFERGGKKVISYAQGIAELMLDYLPWPALEVKIHWEPSKGFYEVTDLKTEFLYEVRAL
jgi:hypothetical protein